MEWLEVVPLPEECINCKEMDCYNCDTAGKRWVLSQENEQRLTRLLRLQAIQRLQRKNAIGSNPGMGK